ncbi:MAG TPA: ABC transporter permease [Bacteroidota bacterium]|nr:ABC transporter permease [Bacteroidota bacterium]
MYFAQELKEGLAIAFRAIRANKMRSVLTTLGIIIGIVAVTGMATAIDGLDKAFEKSARAFGTDILYVQKFPWISNEDWSLIRNRPDIKTEYVDAIERQAKLSSAAAPVVGRRMPVTNGNYALEDAFVTGTTHSYNEASGNSNIDGRFFSAEESDGGRPVCVIGAVVAEKLFPTGDPVGQTIRVGGAPYQVLGVYEKAGGLWGRFTSDNRVFMPLNAFENRFGSRRFVTINVKVADVNDIENAKLELEGILRKVRRIEPGKENNFNINAQEILTQTFGAFTMTVGAIGLFITGLSLLVGGIGIMNIMFVSVTERTREIGIRKAIGARKRTILMQFLIEAAALCLIGGLIGLAVAFILVQIVSRAFELEASMPVFIVFIAILVSLMVGLTSGFLPAYRAAKMDPVEALRYE